jgi:hypothetical protein
MALVENPVRPVIWRWAGGSVAIAVGIGVLDIVLFAAGIGLSYPYGRGAIAGSIAAIAFATFFGVLALSQHSRHSPIGDRDLRHAVASSFVITYFAIMITFFFTEISPTTGFAEDLLGNFTTLMITVVGFYLGSTALLDVVERRERGKTERQLATQSGVSATVPPTVPSDV